MEGGMEGRKEWREGGREGREEGWMTYRVLSNSVNSVLPHHADYTPTDAADEREGNSGERKGALFLDDHKGAAKSSPDFSSHPLVEVWGLAGQISLPQVGTLHKLFHWFIVLAVRKFLLGSKVASLLDQLPPGVSTYGPKAPKGRTRSQWMETHNRITDNQTGDPTPFLTNGKSSLANLELRRTFLTGVLLEQGAGLEDLQGPQGISFTTVTAFSLQSSSLVPFPLSFLAFPLHPSENQVLGSPFPPEVLFSVLFVNEIDLFTDWWRGKKEVKIHLISLIPGAETFPWCFLVPGSGSKVGFSRFSPVCLNLNSSAQTAKNHLTVAAGMQPIHTEPRQGNPSITHLDPAMGKVFLEPIRKECAGGRKVNQAMSKPA
ncbi:hypothetical protein L345_16470, partial [Ophiophagus hannah]